MTAPAAETDGDASVRYGRLYMTFAFGFGAFAFLMAVLSALGVPDRVIGSLLSLFTVTLFAVIAVFSRTMQIREYFAAGRGVPATLNGMAMAAGGISATSFMAMVAALYLLGHSGFAFVLGGAGGFVIGSALISPYLRRSGAYTLPDFLSVRYGATARLAGVVVLVTATFPALVAQLHGFGTILERFLGLNYQASLYVGLAVTAFSSVLGGMRSVTWTQIAQYLVLAIAVAVVTLWILTTHVGLPISDLAFGRPLPNAGELSAASLLTGVSFAGEAYSADFWLLALCLMLGTASLPHLATRAVTAPDAIAARTSFAWGLLFTVLLCLAAPVFAAFARWTMLETGAAGGQPDLVMFAVPEMAGMPYVFTALVAIGGLAALLAAASGLLVSVSNSLGHDVYFKTLARRAPASSRLIVSRILMLGIAGGAAYVAEHREFDFLTLTTWSFALAAAGLFPALVLGIWWTRVNAFGAVLGIVAGFGVTLCCLAAAYDPAMDFAGILDWLPRVGALSVAVFGVPVGLAAIAAASLSTRKPALERQNFVEALHRPNGGTIVEDPVA